MPQMREVKTCERCRTYKRRCDLVRPACSRCVQAGATCSFQADATSATASAAIASAQAQPISASVPIRGSPAASVTASDGAAVARPSSGNTPTGSGASTTSPGIQTLHSYQQSSPAGLISPSTTDSPDAANSDSYSGPNKPQNQASPREASAGASSAAGNVTPQTVTGTPRVIRKRKRNCLSCLRCHRLKVKCDKELPCGRCKSSGNGRDCYYSYNKGPSGGKFPCPTAQISGDDAKAVHATWEVFHKDRGSSHWRDLVSKIASLSKGNSKRLATALEAVATNACLASFTLPGNFPFGTPGASKFYARDAVVRLVEAERENCTKYIDEYIHLVDCVNPVLDMERFQSEVERYWLEPNDVSLCWLSQFLMILGLGCFACSAEESSIATELMMAAEACLMQTPFMFRPTLLMLKTLTLMVVAKQLCNTTCWANDSCWSLLGLVVRTAYIYGLPQESVQDGTSSLSQQQDATERDARRKLWLTIVYLDVRLAVAIGMPPLTKPDEVGTIRDRPEWGRAESLHIVLYQSLPTVLSVLEFINRGQNEMPYDEVMTYHRRLRDLVAHARVICPSQLQRITVDIFLRRCLIGLHRSYALHAEAPVMYPESYWSSIECSLALMMHYREIFSPQNEMRVDLREDAPLAAAAEAGCEVPTRTIITDLLRECIDIFEGEVDRSVCYRAGYQILRAVMSLLPQPLPGAPQELGLV